MQSIGDPLALLTNKYLLIIDALPLFIFQDLPVQHGEKLCTWPWKEIGNLILAKFIYLQFVIIFFDQVWISSIVVSPPSWDKCQLICQNLGVQWYPRYPQLLQACISGFLRLYHILLERIFCPSLNYLFFQIVAWYVCPPFC